MAPRPKNLIEKNPNTSQFVINSILVLLTLAALITTVIFSNKGLNENRKQYDLASKQLTLATNQFNKSIAQHIIDSTISAKKDIHDSEKQKSDSILSAKKYLTQEQRNTQQEKLYKKQLEAIELQAQTAKKQFDAQIAANNASNTQNKPIFILFAARYDSLKNCGIFTFRNIGKRPATIIHSSMCSINITRLVLNLINEGISKYEVNEFNSYFISLPMQKLDYDQENTLYYLSIDYIDAPYNTPQKLVKYFVWHVNTDKSIGWSELTEKGVDLIKHHAKLNKFHLEDS